MHVDLVLSSGFLAFAEQAGFLRAVEESGVTVDALCGTSSGALAGALWLSGLTAEEVLERLTAQTPWSQLRWSPTPWRGLFRLDRVLEQLAEELPESIEDLPVPFAAGVVDDSGTATLRAGGPLVRAVLASSAIPYVFEPISMDGRLWSDGGARDRTALTSWRQVRPHSRVVLHRVQRSSGRDLDDDLTGVHICPSPRSGAHLWDLGDVRHRYEATRQRTKAALLALVSPPSPGEKDP